MRLTGWRWRRSVDEAAPTAAVRLPAFVGGRDVELVLGLAWHTILGTDLRREALRRARSQRATHIVHAGGRSESVGTVRLAPRRGRMRREAHAAAQLFATQAGQGAHAAVWPLDTARVWVAQARDGRVLAGGDLLTDAAGAQVAVAQFRQRFGLEAPVYAASDAVGLQAVAPAPSLEALAAGCGPASVLQAGPRPWRALAVLPLLMALPALAWQAQRLEVTPPPDDDVSLPVETPDPQTVRTSALAAAVAALTGPSVDGLAAVWAAVGALPLRPAGWRLHAARCRHDAATGWGCEADYARGQTRATAADLTAHGLPGTLHWQGMDQASARFTVPAETRTLTLAGLQATGPGLVADADTLQALRPAFAQVHVGPAVAVPAPPRADGQAQPALLRQREVRLRGPLRSLTLIDASLTERVVWHTLHVSFEPGAQARPDASVVLADLQGVIYEPTL